MSEDNSITCKYQDLNGTCRHRKRVVTKMECLACLEQEERLWAIINELQHRNYNGTLQDEALTIIEAVLAGRYNEGGVHRSGKIGMGPEAILYTVTIPVVQNPCLTCGGSGTIMSNPLKFSSGGLLLQRYCLTCNGTGKQEEE